MFFFLKCYVEPIKSTDQIEIIKGMNIVKLKFKIFMKFSKAKTHIFGTNLKYFIVIILAGNPECYIE